LLSICYGFRRENYIAELQRRFLFLWSIVVKFYCRAFGADFARGGVYGNMLVGFLIYSVMKSYPRQSELVMNETILRAGRFRVNVLLLLIGSFLVASCTDGSGL